MKSVWIQDLASPQTACAPFDEKPPGLAHQMYDQWKTNPQTMVPYPDTPAVLKSFASAGIPIGIVSNTGWSIDKGYARRRS